jgi:hypothetical protein
VQILGNGHEIRCHVPAAELALTQHDLSAAIDDVSPIAATA